jgi:uncharacterized YkwD family protein
MKNKVIALSLLITALSVVPAFADTNSSCNSIDFNKILSNSKIIQEGVSVSKICNLLPSDLLNCKGLPDSILSGKLNTKINMTDLINKTLNNKNCGNSGTTKPEIKLPDTKNPGTTNPGTTNPGTTNPGTTNPGTTNPGTTNPEKPTTGKDTSTSSSVSSYERQVVELVNAERAKVGVAPLSLDSSISNVARTKSKDMATNNYFSHTSPTYGNAASMLKQFGIKYTAYGENIASGQKTPQQVVSEWMKSQGHKENILSSTFTKIGVGYATNSKGVAYWTQMFVR